ncbi:hypothetical protein ABZX51_009726 [Aspergillus tubingensis]
MGEPFLGHHTQPCTKPPAAMSSGCRRRQGAGVHELRLRSDCGRTLHLLNVYNDEGKTAINILASLIPADSERPKDEDWLVFGRLPTCTTPRGAGERRLEPGTITWERAGRQTTVDLVFGTSELTTPIIVCETASAVHSDSDPR